MGANISLMLPMLAEQIFSIFASVDGIRNFASEYLSTIRVSNHHFM